MSPPRILVVDDEPDLRREVARGLRDAGFEVSEAMGAAEARSVLERGPVDLVVLDVRMPEEDGWSLLPELTGDWSAPVILLTASSDVQTRTRAFRAGAADYMSKPFFIEELAARIRTRLRVDAFGTTQPSLSFAGCVIDLEARSVSVRNTPTPFTPAEFDILAYLAARPGRAVTRDTLASQAMSSHGDRSDRTVDSHVSRIRAKLGEAGNCIQTVWGIGWKLDPGAG